MEKVYNCYGQIIYKSQINENGERISDSKGNKVEFDINGLPIK